MIPQYPPQYPPQPLLPFPQPQLPFPQPYPYPFLNPDIEGCAQLIHEKKDFTHGGLVTILFIYMHCVYSFYALLFNFDAVILGNGNFGKAHHIIILFVSLLGITAGILGILGILFKSRGQIIASEVIYSFIFVAYFPPLFTPGKKEYYERYEYGGYHRYVYYRNYVSAGTIFLIIYILCLIIVIGVGLCQGNQYYYNPYMPYMPNFNIPQQSFNQASVEPQKPNVPAPQLNQQPTQNNIQPQQAPQVYIPPNLLQNSQNQPQQAAVVLKQRKSDFVQSIKV